MRDDLARAGGHNNDESLIEQGPDYEVTSRPVRPPKTCATPARADPSVSGKCPRARQ